MDKETGHVAGVAELGFKNSSPCSLPLYQTVCKANSLSVYITS